MSSPETTRRHFSLTSVEEEFMNKLAEESNLKHSEVLRRIIDYYRRSNAYAMRNSHPDFVDNIYRQACYSIAGISPTRVSDPFEPGESNRDAEVADLL